MKNISSKHVSTFEDGTEFQIDSTSAAVIIDYDGSLTIYIPEGRNSEEVPEHVIAVTAMAIYLSENYDQVIDWWKERSGNVH